ncbi:MAG: glycosyltransferase [Bacteroidota bacterium]
MGKELVSILINNYNNGPFLRWCIDSALDQTYSNVEVIVYDDASTDDSLDILRSYDDQIQVLAAKKNYGAESINFNQANAIHQAFQQSKGDIICLLDGDDAFLPHKVEAVVAAFQANPAAVLVQHYFEIVNEHNQRSGVRKPLLIHDPMRFGQDHLAYYRSTNSLFDLYAQTSALSFRRSYLELRLPLPEDELDLIWPDVRLTRLAPFYGQVVVLPYIFTYYRMHQSNWVHSLEEENRTQKARQQIYQYFNTTKPDATFPRLSLERTEQGRWCMWATQVKRWRTLLRKLGFKRI